MSVFTVPLHLNLAILLLPYFTVHTVHASIFVLSPAVQQDVEELLCREAEEFSLERGSDSTPFAIAGRISTEDGANLLSLQARSVEARRDEARRGEARERRRH